MKIFLISKNVLATFPLVLLLLEQPDTAQAQYKFSDPYDSQGYFDYTTNNGAVTIDDFQYTIGLSHTNLSILIIPNSVPVNAQTNLPVTTLGSGEEGNFFYQGALSSVVIPDSVTQIAFWGLAFVGMTNISISANVTNIGDAAFLGCYNLNAINVNSNNPSYVGVNGVLFDKSQTTLIDYPAGVSGNYSIPSGVTTVRELAFEQSGLTGVTIPATVTNIGPGAFEDCASLNAINVSPPNSDYSSSNGVLFDKSQSTLVAFPAGIAGSYTIPSSVASIGYDAFAGCGSLTNVTFTGSVTSIGGNAFFACGLTSVNIIGAVSNLGHSAFSGCSYLTSATIGNGVTDISTELFSYCPYLASVIIGNSVTNIEESAFEQCTSLKGVFCLGNAPGPGTNLSVFSGVIGATVYYLPGTSGWGTTYDGLPTATWLLPNPIILNNAAGFGIQAGGFGFTISWATNTSVVVEVSTNLVNASWEPVQTNVLSAGTAYFSDPNWTNYPSRFYRLRSQ